MENLFYYNKVKSVPTDAKRLIESGRLKGKNDINPMWRIKVMTETFGPCGIGWKYEITKQWNEVYGQEIKTYCNINLYVKVDGEWSEPIPGTGGSTFVAMERNGAYVSDENNKMALTDALSVAMKALGVAADVYWEKGARYETKYGSADAHASATVVQPQVVQPQVAKQESQPQAKQAVKKQAAQPQEGDMSISELLVLAKDALAQANTREELKKIVENFPQLRQEPEFLKAGTARKKALGIE